MYLYNIYVLKPDLIKFYDQSLPQRLSNYLFHRFSISENINYFTAIFRRLLQKYFYFHFFRSSASDINFPNHWSLLQYSGIKEDVSISFCNLAILICLHRSLQMMCAFLSSRCLFNVSFQSECRMYILKTSIFL